MFCPLEVKTKIWNLSTCSASEKKKEGGNGGINLNPIPKIGNGIEILFPIPCLGDGNKKWNREHDCCKGPLTSYFHFLFPWNKIWDLRWYGHQLGTTLSNLIFFFLNSTCQAREVTEFGFCFHASVFTCKQGFFVVILWLITGIFYLAEKNWVQLKKQLLEMSIYHVQSDFPLFFYMLSTFANESRQCMLL